MQDDVQKIELNRLKFFPIMMFAIVMGLSGLTITYQKAAEFMGFPHFIGYVLMVLVTIIFLLVSAIYILKFVRYPKAVAKEFAHPVRINFFSAVSISMLMLAIIYKDVYPSISALFWYPGTLLHLFMTLYTITFWINHNQEVAHSNPAWFIPIVGNILVPVAGVGFANEHILMYFFSVGLFFWVILFAVVLNRIIFHNQLAQKFMPTLFIFLAPPAVGFIAYYKMYGELDTFAMFLFNIAIFFTLLLAFMYRNFMKLKFFISWWAFVFPVAAMAISSMLMYHLTKDNTLYILSLIMIAVTTVMTAVVLVKTIQHMRKHEICIQE